MSFLCVSKAPISIFAASFNWTAQRSAREGVTEGTTGVNPNSFDFQSASGTLNEKRWINEFEVNSTNMFHLWTDGVEVTGFCSFLWKPFSLLNFPLIPVGDLSARRDSKGEARLVTYKD